MNDEFIKKEAQRIRTEVEAGRLFGKEVDVDNIDEMIVAVYFFAISENIKKQAGENERRLSFFGMSP
jgi:hypothetical protein